tara:strand:+ start:425 stop:679 length:255 start_codon:yes stop_codon:yes gene_type:complete
MPLSALPPHSSLAQLKNQAKDLLEAHRVAARLRQTLPHLSGLSDREVLQVKFSLKDAQRVVARVYGFEEWSALKTHVEQTKINF